MSIPLHYYSLYNFNFVASLLGLDSPNKKSIFTTLSVFILLSTYIMSPFHFIHSRMCSNDTIEIDISSFPYVVWIQ